MRKPKTESNTRGSDMKIESAIIKDSDSTTKTSVHTISARVSPETLNSDQTIDDLNYVCVKIETDEWSYRATDFYSVCTKSEQVSWKERHPDCNKQDGFNLVHEQTGCLQMEQDYTKLDCFNSECVESEQMECEVMHQDVTRQACVNSVCVIKNTTSKSNAYTSQDELHSVFGKTKQSLNLNTDESYITTNDLNYVCGIAKQCKHSDTENGNTTANDHNALWDHTYSKTHENMAKLADLNSVFLKREEIELSNVDQYCGRPTVGREIIKLDHYTTLNMNPPHMPMPVISCDSRLSLSQDISESQSHKMPLSMSPNMAESAVTSEIVTSNLAAEPGESCDDDSVEIFIERDKMKSKSYHSTLPAPKRYRGQGSSRGVVNPIGSSVRENAENALTAPLFLPPAKMKMNEKCDQVKKVKRKKKAKIPEKDKTEYSLKETSLASCMNLELPYNHHFLYCIECNKEFEGDCPVHGPYNYIQDKEVPEGDLLKAEHTLPDCLEIKTSKLAGSGLGVFSKEGLQSRIMFGPYVGDIITDNHKSGYCWKTLKDGIVSRFEDDQNKATSNWMRYVNCAVTETDRNIVALQYKGGIYYCTLKPVSPGEELKVWYGVEFARELVLIKDKNLCSYSSKNSGHLEKHIRIHTGERPYKCEVCGYLCKNSGHLQTHISKHREKKLYTCEVCGRAFKQSGDLKRHMMIHTGERLYKCEVCDYSCIRSGDLKTHMMTHTGERPYKCEVCDYSCIRSYELKKHIRIHTGERPFKCEVCGKAFEQSGDLKKHLRIHTRERPYKCEVCGYICKHSGNLKKHLRIHTGERPYTCEMCSYACKESSNLKRHMRKHTGERPYKCEVCGYACNDSGNLKKHMTKHSGERLYKCEVCACACNTSGNLKKHMRIHTGEGPYKCEVCGYSCIRSGDLKKHMMKHTGSKTGVVT